MLSAFHDGIQYAFDSTSIKLAETCPYKYKLKIIEGWQSKSLSVHLRFGLCYATALEHYYKHLANGLSSTEALVEVIHEALKSTWDRGTEYTGPWISDNSSKTRENLIRTIVWYVDQFAQDQVKTVMLSNGKPAVEYSFSFEVDDGIVFCGHIDRLVSYTNDIYVMDQKTTASTISSNYFSQYSPDTQVSMYTFAGKIIYDLPVQGMIIDAAQIAVNFSRFERGFVPRTEGQLNEWYDQTLYKIDHIRDLTREQFFPMNDTACNNYGGCEFRRVCSKSPEVRYNFLVADFVKTEPWNPLARR